MSTVTDADVPIRHDFFNSSGVVQSRLRWEPECKTLIVAMYDLGVCTGVRDITPARFRYLQRRGDTMFVAVNDFFGEVYLGEVHSDLHMCVDVMTAYIETTFACERARISLHNKV